MKTIRFILVISLIGVLSLISNAQKNNQPLKGSSSFEKSPDFVEALANGKLANEGYNRCMNYLNAWLSHADKSTGLIPRNLKESVDYWNAWDAAADNYPFMVLTASILSPELFKGKMIDMLNTERKLTSRLGALPDTYSFSKKGFKNAVIDTSEIIFGTAEYMKDGLIPLTEWLGKSPWSDRMLEMLDDLGKQVRIVKHMKQDVFGISSVVEVNGDLLQTLSRMYWFTGEKKYLLWAADIADYYLTDEHLPTKALEVLKIRDHGCEIISGLCEIYLAAYYSWPEKRNQWRKPIHEMLDRILEVGRNEDGLFYDAVNPITGKIVTARLADNFGYTFNAYYYMSVLDSTPKYKDAVIKGLSSLNSKYRNHDWESGSCDGYADAIEGGLNLYNREAIPSLKEWLDSEIRVMWNFQKPDGIIEGWHGDGNFARTAIMYCMWKAQGISAVPWKSDLILGAVKSTNGLKIAISSPSDWSGKLKFDVPKYSVNMHYPIDYPRINQFQNWFSVKDTQKYQVEQSGTKMKTFTGKQLSDGIQIGVKKGEPVYINVR
jgi:hypothetical protein